MGDGALRADQVLARAGDAEVFVGVAAGAGVGGAGEDVALLRVVQGVVQAGDGADGVAQRRVGGDVLHAFAVDVDLPPVAQAGHVFGAGIGAGAVGDVVFGAAGAGFRHGRASR